MPRVVVSFHRFGPYHHARLNAAGARGDIVGLELSGVDKTNAWGHVHGADKFQRVTLFANADVDELTSTEVVRHVFDHLDRIGPDVVAIPGWWRVGALAQLSWCVKYDVPAIILSESQAIDQKRIWWREALKRRIANMFAAALVGGKTHADYLISLGFPKQAIFFGYNVVDNDYFDRGADAARRDQTRLRQQYGLPEHYFVASGRFIPKKNYHRMIEAYARYRHGAGDNPWQLLILGDGPLNESLRESVAELQLDEHVIFPGYIPYDELPIYYGLAGAFVQPSTSEQWGLVVNEAMASRIPVIVSNPCGCATVLVEPETNGFTFDPFDTNELAGILARVASNDCDRSKMSAAARKSIRQCSPEAFGVNLWRAVNAAIASPNSRPSYADRTILAAMISKFRRNQRGMM